MLEPVAAAPPEVDADAPVGIEALERIEIELAEVEQALARLDEGSYGRCAVCGGNIDDADLADRPTASVCAAHLPVLGPV